MPQKVKRVGKYEIQSDISEHRSYPVRHAIDTETGQRYAAKVVPKDPQESVAEAEHEVNVLLRLHHPNVLKLVESISSKRHAYVILELTTGGDVFDLIVMNEKEQLDEPTARSLFQQLVAGLLHCHRNGVAHRDVKPENLLLDDQGTLKLAEFGLSVLSAGSCSADGVVDKLPTSGTPSYVAPELLRRTSYDYLKADVWSCGVVLFAMLSGTLPFDSFVIPELFDQICKGSYTMPDGVPSGAADLIDCLLVVDPAKRLSLEEITEHPWFADGFDPSLLSV